MDHIKKKNGVHYEIFTGKYVGRKRVNKVVCASIFLTIISKEKKKKKKDMIIQNTSFFNFLITI